MNAGTRLTQLGLLLGLAAGLPAAGQDPAAASDPAELPAPAAAPAQPTVLLPATATVFGEQITLGEVAALPADSPLAHVTLAPAPLPGGRRTITRDQIALRLARAGHQPEGVLFQGAESVVVTRLARTLTVAEISAALVDLIPTPVVVDRVPPRRALPTGTVTWRLRTALPDPLPATANVMLDVLVDGRVADSLVIGIRRELPAAAPVAPPAPAPPTTPTAPVAAAPAPPTPEEPRPTWQVKRGDQLTVVATAGRVSIKVVAEARSPGRLGDVIQVQAQIGQEKRLLAARLIAPDRAVLEL